MTKAHYVRVLFLALLGVPTEGFAPPTAFRRVKTPAKAAYSQLEHEHEDEAVYLMEKARECAYSDTCSVEDARRYLNEVVLVQSGCVAGTLSGHALCDDQDVVADIVAHLRAKVDAVQDAGYRLWQIDSDEALIYPEGDVIAKQNVGLSAAMLAAVLMLVLSASRPENALPLHAQEWWWSIKDGYLHTMIFHFLRNGGL